MNIAGEYTPKDKIRILLEQHWTPERIFNEIHMQ